MIAWFLSLALLFQPGDMGASTFYCTEPEAAKAIIDLDFPKVIPDNLPCFFAMPEFTFKVERIVENYKGTYIVEVSNPFNDKERRFVLQFIKGEAA